MVEKDIGRGRMVYKKSQLRLGPYTFTSLLWNRKPKDESASGEAVKAPKTRKSAKKNTADGDAAAPVKTRSPRTAAKPRTVKKVAVAPSAGEILPEKPKARKKKVDSPTEPAS
jgi:hypothetical protein